MGDRTNYCPSCKGYADRIAALEAENARLRDALEPFVRYGSMGADDCYDVRVRCEDYRAGIKAWREVTE